MKSTKRLLTLLLAVLMLASSLPFALAENTAADTTPAAEVTTAAEKPDAEKDTPADQADATTTSGPASESSTAADSETTTTAATEEKPTDKQEPSTATSQESSGETTGTTAATEPTTKEEPSTTPTTKPETETVPVTTTTAPTTAATTPAPAAKSGECGKDAKWNLDDNGLLTISGSGAMKNYKKESDVPWAASVLNIKRVVVNEGITSIGDKAFSGCTHLATVSLPASLKTVGGYAFNKCMSLQAVKLPEGVTDIGWNAFCNCEQIKEMIFPESVKTIGASALAECKALADVHLPSGLKILEYHMFRMCHSLKEITLPKGLTEVGGAAFYNCVKLREITIPRSVTVVGEYAFYQCNSLERITVLNGKCIVPADPRSIPEETLLRCTEGSPLQLFATLYNRSFEAIKDIPEHDHQWGEPVETKKATCVSEGLLTYTCSVCGETKEETTPTTEHTPAPVPAVPATCKSTGLTDGVSCSVCGMVFTPQAVLPKTGHDWSNKVTKAKIGSNGKLVATCKVCKATKNEVIHKINTVKLSETTFVADGTAKTPTVTVKDSQNKKLKKDTDYKLSYSKGRKNVGVYSVTVTFMGNYTGKKTLKFKVLPDKVRALKVKAVGDRKFTLTWDKVKGAEKYVVYYSTSADGKFKKLGNFKKTKLTDGGYVPGTVYYFKVRAVTAVDGKNYFGAYSLTKHAKAKK